MARLLSCTVAALFAVTAATLIEGPAMAVPAAPPTICSGTGVNRVCERAKAIQSVDNAGELITPSTVVPATSTPLTGTVTSTTVTPTSGAGTIASGTATIGPFTPQLGLPVRLVLRGGATFTGYLGTSVDNCATVNQLTAGGSPITYTGSVDEFVDAPPTTGGVKYCLTMTVSTGTETYGVRQ